MRDGSGKLNYGDSDDNFNRSAIGKDDHFVIGAERSVVEIETYGEEHGFKHDHTDESFGGA